MGGVGAGRGEGRDRLLQEILEGPRASRRGTTGAGEGRTVACGTRCTPGRRGAALTFHHPVGRRQLGINRLGLGHLQPPGGGDSDALLVPSDCTPRPHRRARHSAPPPPRCKPLGWSSGLWAGSKVTAGSARPSSAAAAFTPPPPPPAPPPRSGLRVCAGYLFIFLSTPPGSSFILGDGAGDGEEKHTRAPTPAPTPGAAQWSPHARTRSGLRPITWGGPGAREERQGRGCQRRQPRLGFPVVERRLPLRPPLLPHADCRPAPPGPRQP